MNLKNDRTGTNANANASSKTPITITPKKSKLKSMFYLRMHTYFNYLYLNI
jgi:hypothetical protein